MRIDVTEKQMNMIYKLVESDDMDNSTPRTRSMLLFFADLIRRKMTSCEMTVNESRFILILARDELKKNANNANLSLFEYLDKQFDRQHPKADKYLSKHTGYNHNYDDVPLKPRGRAKTFNGISIE